MSSSKAALSLAACSWSPLALMKSSTVTTRSAPSMWAGTTADFFAPEASVLSNLSLKSSPDPLIVIAPVVAPFAFQVPSNGLLLPRRTKNQTATTATTATPASTRTVRSVRDMPCRPAAAAVARRGRLWLEAGRVAVGIRRALRGRTVLGRSGDGGAAAPADPVAFLDLFAAARAGGHRPSSGAPGRPASVVVLEVLGDGLTSL